MTHTLGTPLAPSFTHKRTHASKRNEISWSKSIIIGQKQQASYSKYFPALSLIAGLLSVFFLRFAALQENSCSSGCYCCHFLKREFLLTTEMEGTFRICRRATPANALAFFRLLGPESFASTIKRSRIAPLETHFLPMMPWRLRFYH